MDRSRGDEPPDIGVPEESGHTQPTASLTGAERAHVPGDAGSPASPAVLVTDDRSAQGRAGDEAVDCESLRQLTLDVMTDLGVSGMAVDVLCVDTTEMAALNAEHMGVDGPTDVLAFPIDAPGEVPVGVPALLGDVVLCPAVAYAQAGQSARSGAAELEMLLVHGLLHLLGHDHEEAEERKVMFALTDRLLAAHARGAR